MDAGIWENGEAPCCMASEPYYCMMDQFTTAALLIALLMDRDAIPTPTLLTTRVASMTTLHMDWAFTVTKSKSTCTRENGLTTKLTVTVSTLTQTVLNMLATGKKTSRMDRELKPGLMEPDTLEHTSTERNTEKENLFGQMAQDTRESSTITTFMELESTNGQTEENTMESG